MGTQVLDDLTWTVVTATERDDDDTVTPDVLGPRLRWKDTVQDTDISRRDCRP